MVGYRNHRFLYKILNGNLWKQQNNYKLFIYNKSSELNRYTVVSDLSNNYYNL